MENTTITQTEDHAESNARGWLQSIHEMVGRLVAADEADDQDGKDELQFEITESVLSVQTRNTAWHSVGAVPEVGEDDEFEILLSTGGPALRVFGELDQFNQPMNIELQKQDWGTPWTSMVLTDEDRVAIEKFVGEFYFGD